MRLLVISPYFPPHIGGLEAYVRDLNEELLALGLVRAITVLAPRLPPGAAPSEDVAPGYRVLRYPAFDVIPNFPAPALWRRGFVAALRKSVDPEGHDLVVSHTRFFLSSFAALLYSRVVKKPLIHVEHGSDYVHLSSRLYSGVARGYDNTLGRLVLRNADAVVAISQAAGRFVNELSGRRAQVIYRGVNRARYRTVEPAGELVEWAGGRPVATFVGRLIDGKGVTDLVRAFGELAGTPAALCVVGDGPRRRDLEELAKRLDIADRCWFVGYRPESEALALIRASDVVVNPSYTEGLPTSVLEGALLGRAILASDVGGTAEVVTDAHSALLVAPGDVQALRRGLVALFSDPALRRRLGRQAQIEAEERFDRNASAHRFIEVACQVLGSSGSG